MFHDWLVFAIGCGCGALLAALLAARRLPQSARSCDTPAVEQPDIATLLDALDCAVLVADTDLNILLSNKASNRFFPAAAVGMRLPAALLAPSIEAAARACLAGGSDQDLTLDSGRVSRWRACISRLDRPDGCHLLRLLVTDDSDRAHADQIRREFVANASHELRTPLTIIRGSIESLLDGGLEDSTMATRFLKTSLRHTKRMARLIDDMLAISKLESTGPSMLKTKPFTLEKCLRRVADHLHPLIEQHQTELTFDLPAGFPKLIGDRFYWEQVFFNLIENAVKNNPEPGLHITVSAALTGGEMELCVIDDGIGIPKTDLPFVFNRFYRVQKDHSNEIPGTGLGLSIVKHAVEAHGGGIRVESSPGQRTAFVIRLPASCVATE